MREKRHFTVGALLLALMVIGYFGAYFLCADYISVGYSRPAYLVRYRAGAVSLDRFAVLFEPARRLDDLCFRHRHAVVLDGRTP